MAAVAAAIPAVVKVAGAAFSIFKGIKGLTGSKKSSSGSQPQQQQATPQVADDSKADALRRRNIGRNALIQSDQEDILGNPTTTARSKLTAI